MTKRRPASGMANSGAQRRAIRLPQRARFGMVSSGRHGWSHQEACRQLVWGAELPRLSASQRACGRNPSWVPRAAESTPHESPPLPVAETSIFLCPPYRLSKLACICLMIGATWAAGGRFGVVNSRIAINYNAARDCVFAWCQRATWLAPFIVHEVKRPRGSCLALSRWSLWYRKWFNWQGWATGPGTSQRTDDDAWNHPCHSTDHLSAGRVQRPLRRTGLRLW